jgi:hypothetical protein
MRPLFNLLLITPTLLTGCLSVRPPVAQLGAIQTKEEKNYTIGVEKTVNVGDSVAIRRSFFYKEAERSDRVKASGDFEAQVKFPLAAPVIYRGQEGEELQVVGTTTVDKKPCRIISMGVARTGVPAGMLVSVETEQPTGKGVGVNGYGAWTTTGVSFSIDRPDTRFPIVKRVEVVKDKPYENWEIIFTGRVGQNITLMYREFTPDDLAKPAFYQNLTYNLENEKTFQFRKLRVEVVRVTNEAITFKVISDS